MISKEAHEHLQNGKTISQRTKTAKIRTAKITHNIVQCSTPMHNAGCETKEEFYKQQENKLYKNIVIH